MGKFTQSTLSTTGNLTNQVQSNINRGTLSATSKPTLNEVTIWLIEGKQLMLERYGFTWARRFVYTTTTSGTYRYALPGDFAGGGTILRDLTQDKRLSFTDPVTFDTLYPDVAGTSNGTPLDYTIKDMELWLQAPANGSYTFELEYSRSGEDTVAETWDYIPESKLFKITDYATHRSFLVLQMWDAAGIYRTLWESEMMHTKKMDGKKKWASLGYMIKNWHYVK